MEKAPKAPRGPEASATGTIERFTYRNPDNGWAVLRLREMTSGIAVQRLKRFTILGDQY